MSPVKRSWTKGRHGEVDVGKTPRIAWAAGPPSLGPQKAKQPPVLLSPSGNMPSPKLGGAWAARDQTKAMSSEQTSLPGSKKTVEPRGLIDSPDVSPPTAETYYASESPELARAHVSLDEGNKVSEQHVNPHLSDCTPPTTNGDCDGSAAVVDQCNVLEVARSVKSTHTQSCDAHVECDVDLPSAGVSSLLAAGVKAWLHEMRLQHLQNSVLRWCAEMGAAFLEEVVEHSSELTDALHLAETREGDQMMSDASAALRRVQAKPITGFLGVHSCLDDDVPPSVIEQAAGDGSSEQSCQPDPWAIPITRERQGKKKKDRIQRRESGDLSSVLSSQSKERSGAIAKEKLELQLKKERDAATEALVAAMKSEFLDQLTVALDTFEKVGAGPHELFLEARQLQERLTRRLQDRCQEAVCALQAAIEAPRDDHFGVVVRDALQSVEHARQAHGGQLVADQAESALRVWQEVQMALRLAVRSRNSEAICLAMDEAKANNLPPRHSLMIEIRRMRQIS